MGQLQKIPDQINQLFNEVNARFEPEVSKEQRAALPLHTIVYDFQKNMSELKTLPVASLLADRVKILSQEKIEYYETTRFGFIKKFFSSLRNYITLGTFTSTGQLGLNLATQLLNSIPLIVKGPFEYKSEVVSPKLEQKKISDEDEGFFESFEEFTETEKATGSDKEEASKNVSDEEDFFDAEEDFKEEEVPPTPVSIAPEPKADAWKDDIYDLLGEKSNSFPTTILDSNQNEVTNPILTTFTTIIEKVNQNEPFAKMLHTMISMWSDKSNPSSWTETVDLVSLIAILLKDAPIEQWKKIDDKKNIYELELRNPLNGKYSNLPGSATIERRIQIQLSTENNQKTISFLKQGKTTGLYYYVGTTLNVYKIRTALKPAKELKEGDHPRRIEVELDGLTYGRQVRRKHPDETLYIASEVTWTLIGGWNAKF